MKVTPRKLRLMSACKDAIYWVEEQKETDAQKLIKLAMKAGRFSNCNWFVTKIMNHEQQIKYAIYAANLVIGIYEQQYPNDDRPRKAIKAAKEYLKDKDTVVNAAAYAAYAADAAASAAAYAAVNAADAAASAAAYAAVNAAAYAAYAVNAAAYAAAYAAYAADAATYADDADEIRQKCINYALRLLKDKL